jgi:hypothetical protein
VFLSGKYQGCLNLAISHCHKLSLPIFRVPMPRNKADFVNYVSQSKLKRSIRTLDKHLATLRKDLGSISDRRETLGV